jgi:hypothetical protein
MSIVTTALYDRAREFVVSVGGKQPGFKGHADAQTTDALTYHFIVSGKATEIAGGDRQGG